MTTAATAGTREEAPLCPRCGASTSRKLVHNGPRAGLEMWGCSRFPECRGAINIDPGPLVHQEKRIVADSYAQRRLEQELERDRLKRRAALPLFVAATVIVLTIAFYSAQPLGPVAAALITGAVGLGAAIALFRMPFDSLVWAKGVEGERRTREYLEPLLEEGFLILENRLIPGLGGDIDSIVIGRTGVFAIETKNWSGKLEARNDHLMVGTSDRTWALAQLYKEALAVQIALGDELNRLRVTVTPVLCAVGGVATGDKIVGGAYVTNGKRLARFILERSEIFDDDAVQRLARVADRRLRQQYAWES